MKPATSTLAILCALIVHHGVCAQLPANVAQRSVLPVELSALSPNLSLPVDPSTPLRVSGGIIAGQIVKMTLPVFPPKTNCLRVSGLVVMHAIIGKDGHVKSLEATFGAAAMRQPTVDAVRQWVYRPFQLHGQSVEVETTITDRVDFNNDGCSTPYGIGSCLRVSLPQVRS